MKKPLIILHISLIVSIGFMGYQVYRLKQQGFGATIPTVVALFEDSLQSKITSSAASITLVRGTDKEGNNLSGTISFTIDEGTSVEEFVTCSASGTALTSCSRGLSVVSPASASAALQNSHRRGASIKVTNYPQLAILSRILNGTDSVPNTLYYPGAQDLSAASSSVLIHKQYADDLAFAGAPDASLTVKGILEVATVAQLDEANGVKVGDDTTAWLTVNPSYLASSVYRLQLPTSDQKNALAGSSGSPSTTNLYITQDDVASASFSDANDKVIRSDGDAVPSALWLDITSFNITASATGDLIVHNGTNFARLASAGTIGFILTSGVATPSWEASANVNDTFQSLADEHWVGVEASYAITETSGTVVLTHGKATLDTSTTESAIISVSSAQEIDFSGDAVLETAFAWSNVTATGTNDEKNAYLLVGTTGNPSVDSDTDPGGDYFGFKIRNDTTNTKLFAYNADGGVQTSTDISSGLTMTAWVQLRAVFRAGVDIKFYANGVLVATHTSNLPNGTTGDNIFRIVAYDAGSASGESRVFYVQRVIVRGKGAVTLN